MISPNLTPFFKVFSSVQASTPISLSPHEDLGVRQLQDLEQPPPAPTDAYPWLKYEQRKTANGIAGHLRQHGLRQLADEGHAQ